MPRPPAKNYEYSHLGIDPGLNGGIAYIHGSTVSTWKMPATEKDILEEVLEEIDNDNPGRVLAVIEQQIPRPTRFMQQGRFVSSILKSTCLLYGNYLSLRMALVATGISFIEVTPQKWQKYFNLVKKKGESSTKWKNRLKGKAQQLFPKVKVTLATADALLIAEYCRRTR